MLMITAKEDMELDDQITVLNQILEQVHCFKYLGSQINYNLQSLTEIQNRMVIVTTPLVKSNAKK